MERTRDEPTRRRLLATTGSLLAAGLAGCPAMETPPDGGASPTPSESTERPAEESTERPAEESTERPAEESTERPATADDGPTAPATSTPALDLREANVVGVDVSPDGDGYRFDVTLYHDDDGEDGYANWWQVETPAGDRLGRRDLLHAHGTRSFTRSETVAVPDDVPCVVVRGHDRTHGYGGQAMVVTVASGATRPVRQGSEPRSLAGVACP